MTEQDKFSEELPDFSTWEPSSIKAYMLALKSSRNPPKRSSGADLTSKPLQGAKKAKEEPKWSEESYSDRESSEKDDSDESNRDEENLNFQRSPRDSSSALWRVPSSITTATTTTTSTTEASRSEGRKLRRVKRKIIQGLDDKIEELREENSFAVMEATADYGNNEKKCTARMTILAEKAFCKLISFDISNSFHLVFPQIHFLFKFIRYVICTIGLLNN